MAVRLGDRRPAGGRLPPGTFRVSARLPEGYRRYRFIDVSREPADGNRNHSGQSVLRVPTAGAALAAYSTFASEIMPLTTWGGPPWRSGMKHASA